MELSAKATRYVIDALEHYERHYVNLLQNEELTEDEISDLVNDKQYLSTIRQSLQECQNQSSAQSHDSAVG